MSIRRAVLLLFIYVLAPSTMPRGGIRKRVAESPAAEAGATDAGAADIRRGGLRTRLSQRDTCNTDAAATKTSNGIVTKGRAFLDLVWG